VRLVGVAYRYPGRLAGGQLLAALVVPQVGETSAARAPGKGGKYQRQGLGAKRGSFVSYRPKSLSFEEEHPW